MNEELNKELCQLLGICWHEPEKDIMKNGFWKYFCSCRVCFERKGRKIHIEESNPDFTSDSGKVHLLREMGKREDYYKFMISLWLLYCDGKNFEADDIDVVIFYFSLATDKAGKLAIAARDFLRKEKN